MEITVGDFGLEWKRKDGKIHKADYDNLIVVYEGQKEHDKEIRNKAIWDFVDYVEDTLGIEDCDIYCKEMIREIAEQMKEVGK